MMRFNTIKNANSALQYNKTAMVHKNNKST